MPTASTLALLLMALGLPPEPPPVPAPLPPRFRLTLLQLPPGLESSSAVAINERGQVVGAAPSIWESASVRRAALWQDGAAQPVLATGPGADFATPTDVDDAGLVIGNAAPSSVQPLLPFTWLPGQDLQSFDSPQAEQEFFEGLNARGAVVGWGGADSALEPHPYLFAGGVTQELGVVPGDSVGVAFAISDGGWIVGISGFEAARWRHGVVERLDVPGAVFSTAMAVNDRGVAVGQATIPGGIVAVVWHATTGIQLPALRETRCTASAINDDTWIVGVAHPLTYQGPGETGNIAVLWLDGQVYDLNKLTLDLPANAELDSAADVNDAGQIVGDATVGGVRRAFLLEPIQP